MVLLTHAVGARGGTPEDTSADIAHAAVWLASEEAGYITGAVLDVNGGLRMG